MTGLSCRGYCTLRVTLHCNTSNRNTWNFAWLLLLLLVKGKSAILLLLLLLLRLKGLCISIGKRRVRWRYIAHRSVRKVACTNLAYKADALGVLFCRLISFDATRPIELPAPSIYRAFSGSPTAANPEKTSITTHAPVHFELADIECPQGTSLFSRIVVLSHAGSHLHCRVPARASDCPATGS